MILSIAHIDMIKTLVIRRGIIRTRGKGFIKFRKGQICNKFNKDAYAFIPGKELWLLYKMGIFTRRVTQVFDYDGHTWWTVWSVYIPKLEKYECFKEIIAQHAVGAI